MAEKEPELILARVTRATIEAIRTAEITLPADVIRTLEKAYRTETNAIAKGELENILDNIRKASDLEVPICQDTGIPVVYLDVPEDVPVTNALLRAVRDGVRQATRLVPLRPNLVDPQTRENTGDNCGEGMPPIHIRPADRLRITVVPKGAGSENMSRIAMLLPSDTGAITRFVVETMLIAEGRPCPPVVLGVGIGGTFDSAAALAKEALLLPIDRMTPLEQSLCDAVNSLGIGPMGLGGDTTALAVKILSAGCHTASLPVAVNVQCWACRRATVEVPL